MKTFARLFLSSATFGTTMATVYYFWSHAEWAGTVLLGLMAVALTFAAGYAIIAERDADLHGDNRGDTNDSAVGEDLGVYTTRSSWPVMMAFSVLVVLVGAVWVPFLLFTGILALVLILWRLGAESNRVT